MPNRSDSEHLDWLEEKLSWFKSELIKAEAKVRQLAPLVVNLDITIAALRVESNTDTLSEPQFNMDALPSTGARDNGNSIGSATSFVPGARKSNRMPNRKNKYANVSIMHSAGQIINGSGKSLHADDVAREIYLITTPEELKAARQNVASDLLRGSKKGFWKALGRNQYVKNA